MCPTEHTRREVLEATVLAGGAVVASNLLSNVAGPALAQPVSPAVATQPVADLRLAVNGRAYPLTIEPRTSLLDVLREQLDLTGTKKGCNQGACGACTVLIDGRRANACLTLAVTLQGAEITTVEGLAGPNGELHPVQRAFIEHDAFQCGYCTPGQILSAVALVTEVKAGQPSHASPDVAAPIAPATLTDAEIRERMSGNICRCGAYPNIVAAVRQSLGELA